LSSDNSNNCRRDSHGGKTITAFDHERKEIERTTMEEMLMATKQKPVREFRLGRIRAAVWANQSEDGRVRFNTTVSRLYHDGTRWQDTTSYGRDDLPLVSKVVHMAHVWIWEQDDSVLEIPGVD
jgi:hypothetical protein